MSKGTTSELTDMIEELNEDRDRLERDETPDDKTCGIKCRKMAKSVAGQSRALVMVLHRQDDNHKESRQMLQESQSMLQEMKMAIDLQNQTIAAKITSPQNSQNGSFQVDLKNRKINAPSWAMPILGALAGGLIALAVMYLFLRESPKQEAPAHHRGAVTANPLVSPLNMPP